MRLDALPFLVMALFCCGMHMDLTNIEIILKHVRLLLFFLLLPSILHFFWVLYLSSQS